MVRHTVEVFLHPKGVNRYTKNKFCRKLKKLRVIQFQEIFFRETQSLIQNENTTIMIPFYYIRTTKYDQRSIHVTDPLKFLS